MSGDDTFEQHRNYLLRYAVLLESIVAGHLRGSLDFSGVGANLRRLRVLDKQRSRGKDVLKSRSEYPYSMQGPSAHCI